MTARPTATHPPTPEQLPAIDPATLARFYTQQIPWSSCGGGFDCGTLQVPLDYANPSGATVSLAVIRHQVANRLGSVVVNPGGPGASGVQFLKSAWGRYAEETQNKFDIVSFDPRGTGESEPIRCVAPRLEDEFVSYDADPKNTAQVAHVGQVDAEFAQGCKEKSGAILAHVGTVEAARDLDVLRAALGTASSRTSVSRTGPFSVPSTRSFFRRTFVPWFSTALSIPRSTT